MSSTVIAAQLYTVREFCTTPEQIADTLHRLARIGYGAVEVAGLGPLLAGQWRDLLDQAGLAVCGAHVGWDRLERDPDALAGEIRRLGAEHVTLSGMPAEFRRAAALDDFAARLARSGAALRMRGVQLGYHNHSFEFEPVAGRLMLERLVQAADGVDFELDTYWVQHGGASPQAWIRRLAGRVPLLHCKDMGVRGGKQVFLPVGEGNLDWAAILDAARQAGVRWYVVEQDRCEGRDPFDCLASSLKYLQAMGLR